MKDSGNAKDRNEQESHVSAQKQEDAESFAFCYALN
jgi:hypothetical protein